MSTEGRSIMRMGAIVLLSLLAIAAGDAHAAPGQREGCLMAEFGFRRAVTLHFSTTPLTWSVRGNSRFVVLNNLGQAVTVDEDTETWVTDANGTMIHSRRPLRDDAPAAQWKGKKILDGLPPDTCPQGMGWLVVYK